jgi:hypothetical protein
MAQTFVRKTAEIQIGDKKLVLTPLTLAELQSLQELNGQLDKLGWIQYVTESSKLITASARRANADVNDSEISMTLDLDSWQLVWNELLTLSGLRVPAAGENLPAAEASTGQNSTPA